MSFRLKLAVWFALSLIVLASVLVVTAHHHLDEELRKDRWDRSHPEFPNWVIHGSYTDEEVQDILGELVQVLLWAGGPLVLLSVVVGYVIALRSVQPIRRINSELAGLQPASLARGVAVPEREPELAALVEHLNELLRRVNHSYEEMAEFSARVAHELRTPLTLLRMRIESTAAELPPDFSEDVQEEIRRLSQLVERLLLTAKVEGGKMELHPKSFDLDALLEDLKESYTLLAEQRSLRWEWILQSELCCYSSADLLQQILHNLFGNALRYAVNRVRCRVSHGMDGRSIVIRLTNDRKESAGVEGGTGIGLRLVRSLSTALPATMFSQRTTSRYFSIRLTIARG